MIRNQAVGWMTLVLIGLVGTFVCGASQALTADQGPSELYGRGVHAYFAGDYELAIKLLTESIAKRDTDPRAYYFRGLAKAGSEGTKAGSADIAKGADLEVNKKDKRIYDVNGALQRVQGFVRMEIEKERSAARRSAAERKKKRDQVRYEELKRRDDIVLFDPDRPAPKVPSNLPKPKMAGQSDPFASGLAFTGGKQVDYVAPDTLQVEAAKQPPDEPDAPAGRDPFGSGKQDDPFASPTKKDDNPFGTSKPPANKMKAEEEPGAESNPFGDDVPMQPDPGAGTADAPGNQPPTQGATLGGALVDLLGKTLSGKTGDRDPFADSDEGRAAKPGSPPPDAPPGNTPPDAPAKKKPNVPDEPDTDPFK